MWVTLFVCVIDPGSKHKHLFWGQLLQVDSGALAWLRGGPHVLR